MSAWTNHHAGICQTNLCFYCERDGIVKLRAITQNVEHVTPRLPAATLAALAVLMGVPAFVGKDEP